MESCALQGRRATRHRTARAPAVCSCARTLWCLLCVSAAPAAPAARSAGWSVAAWAQRSSARWDGAQGIWFLSVRLNCINASIRLRHGRAARFRDARAHTGPRSRAASAARASLPCHKTTNASKQPLAQRLQLTRESSDAPRPQRSASMKDDEEEPEPDAATKGRSPTRFVCAGSSPGQQRASLFVRGAARAARSPPPHTSLLAAVRRAGGAPRGVVVAPHAARYH